MPAGYPGRSVPENWPIMAEPNRERWVSVVQAAILVGVFWWLATGLLLGLPQSSNGRQVAAVVASLVGGSGLALAILYRNDDAPRAAWIGFVAGGTLWAWVQAALYGGWLVGPGADSSEALPASRWAEAMLALKEISWSEAASIGVLVLTAVLAIGAKNRMPFWTVLLLWSAHQLARLNVFLGVANASADLLPSHLSFLKRFFGPPDNSPLLPLSIVLCGAVALLLFRYGWKSGRLFDRRAGLLLGVLAALAALEHVFLGFPGSLGLWDVFLKSGPGKSL